MFPRLQRVQRDNKAIKMRHEDKEMAKRREGLILGGKLKIVPEAKRLYCGEASHSLA